MAFYINVPIYDLIYFSYNHPPANMRLNVPLRWSSCVTLVYSWRLSRSVTYHTNTDSVICHIHIQNVLKLYFSLQHSHQNSNAVCLTEFINRCNSEFWMELQRKTRCTMIRSTLLAGILCELMTPRQKAVDSVFWVFFSGLRVKSFNYKLC